MQVMIGTAELKANHSIQQIVEVISDHEKYPRYVPLTLYRIYWSQFNLLIITKLTLCEFISTFSSQAK